MSRIFSLRLIHDMHALTSYDCYLWLPYPERHRARVGKRGAEVYFFSKKKRYSGNSDFMYIQTHLLPKSRAVPRHDD